MALFTIHEISPACSETITIPAGTRILITLPNNITHSSIESAGTIQAFVAEDIRVNQKIVLPKGNTVLLHVDKVQNPGILGRPGSIQINGGTVHSTQGTKIPLNISRLTSGKSRRRASIAYTIISIPLIFVCGIGIYMLPSALLTRGSGVTLSQGLVLNGSTASSANIEVTE
jgi:hypothetical protein